MRVGACGSRLVWRGARIEPIAELEALVPQSLFASHASHAVDPRTHALELHSQHTRVTVALVEHPGHDHRSVAPGGRWDGGSADDIGDNERDDAARRGLLSGQV